MIVIFVYLVSGVSDSEVRQVSNLKNDAGAPLKFHIG